MAYYQIEPWGDARADIRNGIVAALIYNANRGKNARPKNPDDFVIKTKEGNKKQEQTPQDQAKIGRMLQAAFGGVLKKGKK